MAPSSKKNFRAVALLDRDGTLMHERQYLANPAGVELETRAARALQLCEEQGVARVICTNQSGIGRGLFTEDDLARVHERLRALLAAEGTGWEALYFEAGHEDAVNAAFKANLHRRKPLPGMAQDAVADLGLQGLPLYSIGDKASDVAFGQNAGGRGILVRTGYGLTSEVELAEADQPFLAADDVYDAVRVLLAEEIKAAFPQDQTLARKLKTPGQLRHIVAEQKERKKARVVLANGCFDLLHGGHISFLENARSSGDLLVLAVNSNASIARLKGKGRPILDEPARLQVLAAFEFVDYLTVFYTDSADEVLEEIRPGFHAKGTDYKSDTVPERVTSKRLGIETVICGDPKENSTRDIIDLVVERAGQGLI